MSHFAIRSASAVQRGTARWRFRLCCRLSCVCVSVRSSVIQPRAVLNFQTAFSEKICEIGFACRHVPTDTPPVVLSRAGHASLNSSSFSSASLCVPPLLQVTSPIIHRNLPSSRLNNSPCWPWFSITSCIRSCAPLTVGLLQILKWPTKAS